MGIEHDCMQGECIKNHEERLRSLESDRTETKIYVKLINENIAEIKSDIKKRNQIEGQGSSQESKSESKAWQPVVMELIKLISTAVLILGGAKLLEK